MCFTLGHAPHDSTRLYFGPTANLDATDLAGNLSNLATTAGLAEWPKVRGILAESGGALHVRKMAMGVLTSEEQGALARAVLDGDFKLSMEAGGAMCGSGSGKTNGRATLKTIAPYLTAHGTISTLLIESIFSRTHAGCPRQPVTTTAVEVAQFTATLATALGPSCQFFLYDALPHYAVGSQWPANVPVYGLELGETLTALNATMAAVGVPLAGYWMDCPYEYSRDYPNATSPFPSGSGFEKIAAAVKLVKSRGLAVGKTFNSQQGGSTSDKGFFEGTLNDVAGVAKTVPLESLDYAMVETWYTHPLNAAPETQPYTTAYTALAAFKAFSEL